MTTGGHPPPISAEVLFNVPFAAIRPRGFMTNNNGGPAFPVAGSEHNYPIEGMTLRDYFAAKAMQSALLTSKPENPLERMDIFAQSVAEISYEMADAMLRAKEAS